MSARKLFNRQLNSAAHADYLNLPGIITTAVTEIAGQIWVEAKVTEPMTKCPLCDATGTLTGYGSSQRFWDTPDGVKPCWVTLQNPRYKCTACHKSFSHNLSFLPAPQAKLTIRLIKLILLLIDAGYTNTDIARITGPDESTVRRIRDKRDSVQVAPAHRHPEFLGVDEWKHCDRREMRAVLVDVGNKMPVDLVDLVDACKADNLAFELNRYLAAHSEVRAIVIDMSGAFRNLLQNGFPDLIIVVDHYHVKQALESAFPCTPSAEN